MSVTIESNAIIEAAARAIYDWDSYPMPWDDEIEGKRRDYRELATTVLAAVTPLIRAAALEEAALVAEAERSKSGTVQGRVVALFIEQQIRALKEQP